MKQQVHKLLTMVAIAVTISFSAKAQTISDFENLTLSKADTFWNGQSTPNGATFSSGNAVFNNYYDPSFGGFWSAGFAYTNVQDSTHGDYLHLYSSKALKGFNGSTNYVSVAEDMFNNRHPMVKLSGIAAGKQASGFYISNSTYAYNVILNGNSGARKFGDTTGTHSGLAQGSQPDWFKVVVRKYLGGVMTNDSVEFYLADYRFSNNAQDYIVKDWRWVDLSSLGNVDSLSFHLSSSDNGQFGINTPAFFCIDNFTTKDVASGIETVNAGIISVSPNPTSGNLRISQFENLKIKDIQILNLLGDNVSNFQIISSSNSQIEIDLSQFQSGIYFLKTIDNSGFEQVVKFVKN